MKRKLNLWQKLQILFRFHWLDTQVEFREVAAHPTWYLTHNQKQIDRRLAAFEAEMEKYRKEKEIILQKFKEAEEEIRREKIERSQSENPFS
ncbi:MAG: hypothetical protein NC543_00665 [bacterium]|nr:hypothetical protein [bacterium]MCM1374973.1 hypothetical protein [Muribaculum sp.]